MLANFEPLTTAPLPAFGLAEDDERHASVAGCTSCTRYAQAGAMPTADDSKTFAKVLIGAAVVLIVIAML